MVADMQDELAEILEEFFTEAEENLDQLEQDLIQLEALAEDGTTDAETVARLFRVLHTLKGGAGFLGLEKMAKLAHAGESLLDEVRNDRCPVTKPVMDALLQTNDALKELLALYKARGDDSTVDNSALVAVLEHLTAGGGDAPAPVAEVAVEEPAAVEAPVAAAPAASGGFEINADLLAEIESDPILHPSRDKGDDVPLAAKLAAVTAAAPAAAAKPEIEINADLLAEIENDPILDPSRDKGDEAAVPTVVAQRAPVPEAKPIPVKPAVEQRDEAANDRRQGADERRAAPRRGDDMGGETIRVETARLDKVMNLVGELVLARNTIVRQLNFPEVRGMLEKMDNGAGIFGTVELISRVTQDLQMSVLSTRMQPIKKVFDKIPRQVRELKTQLKKEVDLIIEGEMTEVDKSLVEDLADPMVHMIRNALDHGIEVPEEREMMGKSPIGTLVVRAFYEGNNVVIQVQEDGKGIDPAKIKGVALKKGLITDVQAASMSDAEAIRLIMAPGFSTAEKITDVSGRGVGMDVVNSKIQNLQGTLDIRSEVGMGTCFSIYMPLTLAIVNALIVGSSREGFAIPIGDIAEVIKFKDQNIHRVNDQDVIELRGEPLPLYYLGSLTRHGVRPRLRQNSALRGIDVGSLNPAADLSMDELEAAVSLSVSDLKLPQQAAGQEPTSGFVVVVREGTQSMGLVVDELLGQEEVVVKPVTDMFEYNKAISGATITGDGKVHMILDVPYLLKNLSGIR